ncbi:MAG: GAF domain-containing protein [Elusimicrobia bacterium]|nr:GAF domain-containing protein [Elusimicrobiota bacterium]
MTDALDAEKRLNLLVKFGGIISDETKLDTLLELIAEQVRKILNSDRCTVFLIDNETNELWSKVVQNLDHTEIRIPMGKGVAGMVALKGQPINIEDAYSDERFSIDIDRVTGYKTRNVLAVPLKNNKGEMLGVFQVLNKLDNTRFDDNDVGLLLLLSSVAANAIENAQLYETLQKSYHETIYRLAITAEYRDQNDTPKHLKNISEISYLIALALGLGENTAEKIKLASPLHDIGKVGLCDGILLKPGKLTPQEYDEMKKHTLYGAKILGNAKSELLRIAYKITCAHHEKYDGSGYPNKLCGEEIPMEARIVSVADVFDALCMPRVYKPAWEVPKAYSYILNESGKSFDPKVVDAFVKTFPVIKKFYEPMSNPPPSMLPTPRNGKKNSLPRHNLKRGKNLL